MCWTPLCASKYVTVIQNVRQFPLLSLCVSFLTVLRLYHDRWSGNDGALSLLSHDDMKHNYFILNSIYIYIRLKIKPNSVRIRFLSFQIFVLPSTGFELTPLIHCSTIRLALRPAPQTTRPHPHLIKRSFNNKRQT